MSIKGSKTMATKIVKKVKKELSTVKKPIKKVVKKLTKEVSATKKPLSKVKVAKKVAKPTKPKAVKKIAKPTKVTILKKPTKAKAKPVSKSLNKKKPALKSNNKTVAVSAKKKVVAKSKKEPKKLTKVVSKAKPAPKPTKKPLKAKASSTIKAGSKPKKAIKKIMAVKKSKPSKGENKKIATKLVKKKPLKLVPSKISKKIEQKKPIVKKIDFIKKSGKLAAVKQTLSSESSKNLSSAELVSQKLGSASLLTGNILPYQEKDGETYMNDEQRIHFRKLLNAWKDEIMTDMITTVHHMQDEASNFPDPNDRATQEEEFSIELRTRDRELKLVKKIEEALHKLDNHEYGYCDTCGVKIGIRRLEARPTATQCIDCKTLDEIREKQLTG